MEGNNGVEDVGERLRRPTRGKVGWGDGGLGTREHRPIDLVNLHRTRDGKRGRKNPPLSLSLSVFVRSSFLAVWRSRVTRKKLYPILPRPVFSAIFIYLSLSRPGGKLGACWRHRLGRSSASATLSRGDHLSSAREVWCSSEMIGTEKKRRLVVTRCVAGRRLRLRQVRRSCYAGNTRKRSLYSRDATTYKIRIFFKENSLNLKIIIISTLILFVSDASSRMQRGW